ncbi:hypothetical protein M422DRAFT_261546 [Sphaerobolus stellatus SS14]|uniref:Uncharacterized protein n=1 Tax=Sphaerobolus stellatus (strain SS14) TaxID=990650 RepID=A0A0C9VFN0_SPHS4|nr:hypothetical protein M422DRAFT_261546 [Sphaerobolus stellatus SS14]
MTLKTWLTVRRTFEATPQTYMPIVRGDQQVGRMGYRSSNEERRKYPRCSCPNSCPSLRSKRPLSSNPSSSPTFDDVPFFDTTAYDLRGGIFAEAFARPTTTTVTPEKSTVVKDETTEHRKSTWFGGRGDDEDVTADTTRTTTTTQDELAAATSKNTGVDVSIGDPTTGSTTLAPITTTTTSSTFTDTLAISTSTFNIALDPEPHRQPRGRTVSSPSNLSLSTITHRLPFPIPLGVI